MKAGLKRIEATLHDLGTRDTQSATEPDGSTKRPFSFRISVGALEDAAGVSTPSPEPPTQAFENILTNDTRVQTFPTQESGCKIPSLPKFKTQGFTSHRNGANPALAMNMLQEIQEKVACWQTELQKIIQQIQLLYLEGPMVNGWLESNSQEPEPGATSTLRHESAERLMDYVEEICATTSGLSCQSPRAGYRLCGMEANGKVWSHPCPPDQVPSVSMAIARHQKLRQLLGRKEYLETRLTQLAETLVILHGYIQSQ